MPKTTKRFDWEITDHDGNFLDMLTMTRDEAKIYKKKFPQYTVQEISYTDGGDDSW